MNEKYLRSDSTVMDVLTELARSVMISENAEETGFDAIGYMRLTDDARARIRKTIAQYALACGKRDGRRVVLSLDHPECDPEVWARLYRAPEATPDFICLSAKQLGAKMKFVGGVRRWIFSASALERAANY